MFLIEFFVLFIFAFVELLEDRSLYFSSSMEKIVHYLKTKNFFCFLLWEIQLHVFCSMSTWSYLISCFIYFVFIISKNNDFIMAFRYLNYLKFLEVSYCWVCGAGLSVGVCVLIWHMVDYFLIYFLILNGELIFTCALSVKILWNLKP